MSLGDKIKQLRKKRGLSQTELAEKIGIASAHLSRLETGKFQPSIDVLKKLSETLQVSADYLLSAQELPSLELKLEDQSLAERIRLLNSLDGKDKETIIHLIDAILTKKKMLNLLMEANSATSVEAKL